MIEAIGNEFGDRPNIYEIEQIAWSNGKGQTCILLIEAYSLLEAIKLSGCDDGIHEAISARQIGSVCIRSQKIIDENRLKVFEKDIRISSSTNYSSVGKVNVAPDRVQIIADMDKNTFKKIEKHIDKCQKTAV